MHMRIYWAKAGGHVHCRVFTATNPTSTGTKSGDLVFNQVEWPMVMYALGHANVEFREETPKEAGRGPKP